MPLTLEAVIEILRCPKSISPLVHEGENLICTDPACRLQFAIKEEIPIMLVDEATELAPADWSASMQRHGRDPVSGSPA
jgi:uncharacterized protein YbaR (Trm112 family)